MKGDRSQLKAFGNFGVLKKGRKNFTEIVIDYT
jgi:hypothetical protein